MQTRGASFDLRQITITAGLHTANRTCSSCVCLSAANAIRVQTFGEFGFTFSSVTSWKNIPKTGFLHHPALTEIYSIHSSPYPKPIPFQKHRLPFKIFRKIPFQDNCNCIRIKDERVLRSNFAFPTFFTSLRPPTRRLPPLTASQNIFWRKHSKLKDNMGKRKCETIKFLMLISFWYLSPLSCPADVSRKYRQWVTGGYSGEMELNKI